MYIAVSLGETCQTRFQIIRHVYYRMYPGSNEEEFHLCARNHSGAKIKFHSNIFDWQITPLSAVCHYLSTDFDRIFELQDLQITRTTDNLLNTKHQTIHPHAIHPAGDYLTEAELVEGYTQARSKTDYLVARFRDILADSYPRLYIYNRIPTREWADTLLHLLKDRAAHPFKILFYGADQENLDSLADEPLFEARYRPDTTTKPADLAWEGDDDIWEDTLRAFPIRLAR